MRVAVIQLAYTDSEPMGARIERVASLVESQKGADLVVLPELWSAGGFDYPAWNEKAQSVEGPVARALSEAAANVGAFVHAGSIIEKPGEKGPEGRGLWNTSLMFDRDGDLVGTYRKIHRFGFGNGEPKLLEAGEEVVVLDLALGDMAGGGRAGGAMAAEVAVDDGAVCDPANPEACVEASQSEWAMGAELAGVNLDGDMSTSSEVDNAPAASVADDARGGAAAPDGHVKVGLSTCYDLRFPELYRKQVDAGAQVFVIPAAWPAARVAAWRTLLQARAIENQVFVIACNTAGTHAGTEMGGNSAIVAPTGEVLAEAGRGERTITLDIDLDDVAATRQAFPVLSDRRL